MVALSLSLEDVWKKLFFWTAVAATLDSASSSAAKAAAFKFWLYSFLTYFNLFCSSFCFFYYFRITKLSQILIERSQFHSLLKQDWRMTGLTSSTCASDRNAGTNLINSTSDGSSYQLNIGIPFSG